MPITMKGSSVCIPNQFTDSLRGSIDDAVKENFTKSLDYFVVYRNFIYTTAYDAWIFDGTEQKDTVGFKMLQSYPYSTPQFVEGDYIHFDYLHENKLSTFLLLSLDTSTMLEVIGKMKPCTNELRFYGDDGILYRIPVVVDNRIRSSDESDSDAIRLIKGAMTVYCQLNSQSNLIVKNMRFLLGRVGNWTAWKVAASGVNNYMNRYYDDINSARVLELTLEASEINLDTDDLVNGVAHKVPHTPDPNPGHSVDPVYSILITPDTSIILQGQTKTFTCALQQNGTTIAGSCVITDLTTIIPVANYVFTILGTNSFSIKNNQQYITAPLSYVTIRCTYGAYYSELKVLLKGYF